MKRWSRCISFLIVVAMLLVMPAFAAENPDTRASSYIMSTCIYLDKTSNNQFDVWFEIIARGQMDEIGAYEIKIQRSADGQNWTTMTTFTPTSSNGMVDVNTHAHAGYVSYTGTVGYYYRAYIVLYAENGSGRGEFSDYTETLKL